MFDSHAHYDDEAFDSDRELLLDSLNSSGVTGVINIGCDKETSEKSVRLSEKYGFVYASVGIHPQEAGSYKKEDLDAVITLLSHKKTVAIGEIGLDYHYGTETKEKQKELLHEQLAIAQEKKIPVIIHERESCGDCLDAVLGYDIHGVFHSFSGSVETARKLLSRGWYISFSGTVTFKNARVPVENALYVPHDRMLVETDCPYLTPHPFRGKRNDSSMLKYTIGRIAEIRGETFEYIETITDDNARRLFKIDK